MERVSHGSLSIKMCKRPVGLLCFYSPCMIVSVQQDAYQADINDAHFLDSKCHVGPVYESSAPVILLIVSDGPGTTADD